MVGKLFSNALQIINQNNLGLPPCGNPVGVYPFLQWREKYAESLK